MAFLFVRHVVAFCLNERTLFKLFSTGRAIIIYSFYAKSALQNVDGKTVNGSVKHMGYENFFVFRTKSLLTWELVDPRDRSVVMDRQQEVVSTKFGTLTHVFTVQHAPTYSDMQ